MCIQVGPHALLLVWMTNEACDAGQVALRVLDFRHAEQVLHWLAPGTDVLPWTTSSSHTLHWDPSVICGITGL